MGLAGLTAVFGMGTGVTPPVWSPEKCPAGGQAGPGTIDSEVGRTRGKTHISVSDDEWRLAPRRSCVKDPYWIDTPDRWLALPCAFEARGQRPDRGGQAAWLLGPVG